MRMVQNIKEVIKESVLSLPVLNAMMDKTANIV